jgi:hypothetical protein
MLCLRLGPSQNQWELAPLPPLPCTHKMGGSKPCSRPTWVGASPAPTRNGWGAGPAPTHFGWERCSLPPKIGGSKPSSYPKWVGASPAPTQNWWEQALLPPRMGGSNACSHPKWVGASPAPTHFMLGRSKPCSHTDGREQLSLPCKLNGSGPARTQLAWERYYLRDSHRCRCLGSVFQRRKSARSSTRCSTTRHGARVATMHGMTLLKPAELPAIELSATNVMTVLFWRAVELHAILPAPPRPSTAKQAPSLPCRLFDRPNLSASTRHNAALPSPHLPSSNRLRHDEGVTVSPLAWG